jgi:hypothetical protein
MKSELENKTNAVNALKISVSQHENAISLKDKELAEMIDKHKERSGEVEKAAEIIKRLEDDLAHARIDVPKTTVDMTPYIYKLDRIISLASEMKSELAETINLEANNFRTMIQHIRRENCLDH